MTANKRAKRDARERQQQTGERYAAARRPSAEPSGFLKSDSAAIQVTAPNGVVWTRHSDGTSTPDEFLRALADSRKLHNMSTQWNWSEDGRRDQEHDRVMQVVLQWDNGAPQSTDEEAEAFAEAELAKLDAKLEEEKRERAALVSKSYDKELEGRRLQMLRKESDAAFFRHVLESPASPAQHDAAERFLERATVEADELRKLVGAPDAVIDSAGFLPAERRIFNLRSHMDLWRHPCLREWSRVDRRRFKALLAMPMPDPAEMCSECQAPAQWHDYDISLCLFQQPPPPGSHGDKLARLMPGWWERCPACTAYNIAHQWGGNSALPDFTGEQYVSMLPPLLRALFAPPPPKQARKRRARQQPLAVIPSGLPIDEVMARLTEAQAKYPGAEVRRGSDDGWELWPSEHQAGGGAADDVQNG